MHNGHLGATISILFDKRPVGSDAWNDLSPSAEGEEEETGATVACLPLPFHFVLVFSPSSVILQIKKK